MTFDLVELLGTVVLALLAGGLGLRGYFKRMEKRKGPAPEPPPAPPLPPAAERYKHVDKADDIERERAKASVPKTGNASDRWENF